MEGKGVRSPFTAVIMGVLILGLIVAHIEAKSCCRNTIGRNCYNACRLTGTSQSACASLCDCIHVSGNTCPSTHPRSNMLENSEVTTGTNYYPTFVSCPTPDAQACYLRCRLTKEACVKECGCYIVYPPRDSSIKSIIGDGFL
ncbi:Leaf-specific thionin [Thalictrum thalictroides]|uniref:Leaf-specific thionin n=1 Tax=Thalictrum thalictroides TaxID=46969 RepID=A0A7J6X1R1_THATH|nr:Leaf-specific thionin [Thalictrum thalictroides]